MDFVKRGVFQQEITEDGVKNLETDIRTEEEKATESRLKNLPEFQRGIAFRSLAEQTFESPTARPEDDHEDPQSGGNPEDGEGVRTVDGKPVNPFAPPPVTEDEYEFLEALDGARKRRVADRAREEEAALSEFREAQRCHSDGTERPSESAEAAYKAKQDRKPPITPPPKKLKIGAKVGAIIVKKKKAETTENTKL